MALDLRSFDSILRQLYTAAAIEDLAGGNPRPLTPFDRSKYHNTRVEEPIEHSGLVNFFMASLKQIDPFWIEPPTSKKTRRFLAKRGFRSLWRRERRPHGTDEDGL